MKETNYLSQEDALNLVERVAERTKFFNYEMSYNEKQEMSYLLSEIGVQTSDLICIKNLADNYAINAEIISKDEAIKYGTELDDCLFSWTEESGEEMYCMSW